MTKLEINLERLIRAASTPYCGENNADVYQDVLISLAEEREYNVNVIKDLQSEVLHYKTIVNKQGKIL